MAYKHDKAVKDHNQCIYNGCVLTGLSAFGIRLVRSDIKLHQYNFTASNPVDGNTQHVLTLGG
jgi:hypothetical protein